MKSKKLHYMGRIMSALIAICIAAAIVPTTVFAETKVDTTVVNHYTDENSYVTIDFTDGKATTQGDYSAVKSISFGGLPALSVTAVYDKSTDTTNLTADVSAIERGKEEKNYATKEYTELEVVTVYNNSKLTYNGTEYPDDVIVVGDPDDFYNSYVANGGTVIIKETRDDYYTRLHKNVKYTLKLTAAGGEQSKNIISKVDIIDAITTYNAGDAPKAAAKISGDAANKCKIAYEYWEEFTKTAEDEFTTTALWFSDESQLVGYVSQMASSVNRFTTFQKGKKYAYHICLKANDGYEFKDGIDSDGVTMTMNGKELASGAYVTTENDGKNCIAEHLKNLRPADDAAKANVSEVHINNVTVDFKQGDKPVFTGEVAENAPYYIDHEGLFSVDGGVTSSEYWNSRYGDFDDSWGKLVTSMESNQTYTYYVYLKLTPEAVNEGYHFNKDTKLYINGKLINFENPENDVAFFDSSDELIWFYNVMEITPTPAGSTYGDANGDTRVTAADVLLIRKFIAGQNVSLDKTVCDVNGDDKITAADVLMIRKFIAGQPIHLGK